MPTNRTERRKRVLHVAFATLLVAGVTASATPAVATPDSGAQTSADLFLGLFEVQSLDGGGNNPFFPSWGRAGTNYSRVAAARYADGRSQPVAGPNSRYVSNRVHNDVHQNLFSERRVTQWGFVWGQFIDHTIGLRDETGAVANIAFSSTDPLESFTNTLGVVPFNRSAAAPGTGVTNVRQQVNTVGSYIDLSAVYGDTASRLEWLRNGPVDGNMANNSASLLLPGSYLPRRTSRGDPTTAPVMAIDGRLLGQPTAATVAGDVRANENIGLTATHTLFAREHNRIISQLPSFLSQEDRFQIARRIVIAEQQHITYNEFLPALGITLPAYNGYNPFANANLSNEFATVGYRAHSQIHGELELETDVDRYTQAQLDAFEAQGIEVIVDGDEAELVIPLNVAFYYETDHSLSFISAVFGLDYRRTLAQVIASNTDIPLTELNANVFLTTEAQG